MTAKLKPRSDTQRIVEWDELPPSVKEIPEGLNPLDEGVLMKHQRDWLELTGQADLAVAGKGRRTGITFAEALGDTLIAAARKSA